MRYEHLFRNADGTTIKAIVEIFDTGINNSLTYRVELYKRDNGKQKYYRPYDDDSYTFRALSMGDRREKIKQCVIDIIGKDDYNNLLIEAWSSLKPELL